MRAAFNISDQIDCQATDLPAMLQTHVPCAVASHVYAPPGVEWIDPADLTASHQAEWQALVTNSAEANVFAEPWMVIAGLRHCAEGSGARLAFVRNDRCELIGVAPLAVEPSFGRVPLRTACGWNHPNSFLTAWTVSRADTRSFWLTLLAAMAQGPVKAPILCLDGLPADSLLLAGLMEATRLLGLPVSVQRSVTRAMLATRMGPEAYWDEAVRPKKRRELRRQWARLSEEGALTTSHLSASAADDVDSWLCEFLALEASGWKGVNRSALVNHDDTRQFFLTAMHSAHDVGQIEITALRLNGRAIAMLITLFSGGAGFAFKTAFDEDYARFSPGVLLQRESLALLSQRGLDWIDSCAAQDHPVMASLWLERRTIVAVALPLPGVSNRIRFDLARALICVWHWLKQIGNRIPFAFQHSP